MHTGRAARPRFRGFWRRVALAAALGVAPVAAFAADLGPFLGRWDAASTDCSYPQGDGVFVVERQEIRFFESICEIGSVRPTGVGSAVTAKMTCEGEGETWTDGLILAASEENTLIVFYGSGYGFVAGRCGR